MKRYEPRLNLGFVLGAALFADLLLWALVIVGVESVGAPEAAGAGKFLTFVFPCSHGLIASALWSGVAALVGWRVAAPRTPRCAKVAWALALAVLSHFVLDLIVHVPDLPVLGNESSKIGLGLWRQMPLALVLELLVAAVALVAYLRSARLSRRRTRVLAGTVVVTAAFTAAGPYIPGELPPAAVLGISSLAVLIIIVVLGFVVEGRFGALAAQGHAAPNIVG